MVSSQATNVDPAKFHHIMIPMMLNSHRMDFNCNSFRCDFSRLSRLFREGRGELGADEFESKI